MRYYNKSQIDQSKVVDDYYYVTFALIVSTLKVTLLQIS